MIAIIQRHIMDMEPETSPDKTYVWLDLLSTNPHDTDQLGLDLRMLEMSLTQAKPTLICMDANDSSPDKKLPFQRSSSSEPVRSHALDQAACLIMYRSREGLPGGFSGLRFDTVNVMFI